MNRRRFPLDADDWPLPWRVAALWLAEHLAIVLGGGLLLAWCAGWL